MTNGFSPYKGRSLPVQGWPSKDRSAWEAALHPAIDVFSADGKASHWRPNTQRTMASAYGRWLQFLGTHGCLEPEQTPAHRACEDRLRAYIEILEEEVASKTRAGLIRDLDIMLGLLDPDWDDRRLKTIRQRLKSCATPTRDKRARLVPIEELLRLGVGLTNHADAASDERSDRRACLYRDGLIILILCFRPLRRANLTELRLGETFLREHHRYVVRLPASSMKNNRPYEARLPSFLTPLVDRYLDHYRSILLGDYKHSEVLLGAKGTPITVDTIYHRLIAHTEAHLGVRVSPHLFRDIAITSLGEENPELVRLGQTLLHHADARTTEAHYSHAQERHAVKRHQEVVLAHRGPNSLKKRAAA